MSNKNYYDAKEAALAELKECDAQVVAMAYLYAKNYCKYGVDISKMLTAVENSAALEKAYLDGLDKGLQKSSEYYRNSVIDEVTATLKTHVGNGVVADTLKQYFDYWAKKLKEGK